MPTPRSKNKRAWLRFSFRTLLAALTLLCIWMGWLIPRAQHQSESVEWVLKQDGSVYYEFQLNPDRTLSRNVKPWAPQFLIDLIGIDYFSSVGAVHLNKLPVTDISPLAGFKNLRDLEMSNKGGITDISLLAKLSKLERIYLGKNPISDFSPIRSLSRLEEFSSFHTNLSDIEPIAGQPSLKKLNVYFSELNDISSLSDHPTLESLDISHTAVNDISALTTNGSLRNLTITGCEISPQDIVELQTALPNCKVTQ